MKRIIIFSLLLLPFKQYAQDTKDDKHKRYVHTGIFCADVSIAPGFLINQNISTISIPAGIEFYMDSHVSFKADVYYHVTSGLTSDSLRLTANHQLFCGAAYHFTTKGYFDPYFAFQPGVSYGQVTPESKLPRTTDTPNGKIDYNGNLAPILGLSLGFNYYFPRFFHIFVEARYVHGTLLYNAPAAFPLDELKIQFGLGWNLNLIKQKKA
jgi:hypothetical protein